MFQNNIHVSQDVLATKGIRFANYIVDNIVQLFLGFVVGVAIALFSELTESYAIYDTIIESDNKLIDYLFGS